MASPTMNSVSASYVYGTGVYWIDSLLWGTKWGGSTTGTPVALTYSFPGYGSYWWTFYPNGVYDPGAEPWNYFFPLSGSEQTAAISALASWSNVAKITFTQVADSATTVGEIRFGWTGSGGGQAHVADFPSGLPSAGDVWLNYFAPWPGGLSPGSYGYSTLIHEIGHALGLKHTFSFSNSIFAVLPPSEDGYPYSVMSYSAFPGYAGSTVNFEPTTPMLYDIAAIQYLYGPNMSYHAGNDVYTFTQGQNYFQTIWDAGGIDAIVWDASTEGATIDLRPGAWSDLGNTLIFSSSSGSFLTSNPNTVAIYYTVTIENATGGQASDTLIGNDANNILAGRGGSDVLDGGLGADVLDGGLGADILLGGGGGDTYVVDDAGDSISETSTLASEIDTVQSSISWTLGANLENLTLTGVGNINGTGNALANTLTGNAGANRLDGGLGADKLNGGTGNDTYVIDNAGDSITETSTLAGELDAVESSVSWTLGSNLEDLTLTGVGNINATGNGLANLLIGNSGGNILNGGGGSDTLIGGLGDDTYVVDGTGDVITEGMGEGTDTVTVALATAGATYVLGANVENGTLSGTVALNLTGSDVANVLTGNSAANKLDGGLGADVLIGGGGGDTYVVDDAGDSISETSTLAGEIDTVQSSISWTLGANLENLTLVGSAAAATGNALANTLTGNAGANRLDGGLGADKLNGGAGNDTYVVDNTGDTITETSTLAGEIDTVESSISWTLGSNLEDLTLTGVGNINATGNTLANVLTGNAGNNVLDGGTGADGLVGGAGNDTYVIDNAGDTVTEELDGGTDLLNIKTATAGLTYALGANVENAALLNTVAFNLTGNDLSNILTGNAAANVLTGAGGNDTLDGKGGSDTLIGGLGDDTYVVDGTGDVITEGMGEGTDTVTVALATAGATYVLGANVENGTLSGTVALNLTGSDVANVLTGNSAANKLDGGLGADVLIGGGGGDTYVVDDAGDSISETSTLAGEIDTVQSSISWTLGANLENLTLVGSAAAATGNALANTLTGNAGANRLDGGLGADKLNGGAGNDTYVVDNTGDTITETSTLAGEIDTVESSISWTLGSNLEDLTLTGVGNINATGNTLANVLTGNAGNNVLDGGTGADGLVGGAGNDTYVIDNAGDTVTEELDGGTDLLNIKTATAGLTYALGANVENAALLNTVAFNLTGNDLSNILTGNAAANVLTGAGGNDTLDGKGGSDTLIGGLGDDTYVVDGTGDVITEGMGEGTDTVTVALATAGATYVLGANVENGTLSGTVALNLTGSDVANVLTGNSAANKLDGGLGADVLIGGGGGDTYVVDDAGDSISETSTLAGEIDTVQSSISWTLGANLENLTLVGSAAAATGNALANTLTGNAGANRLDGGLGADKLNGGAGNDTYVVDNTGDTITETSTLAGEIDTVESSISWTLGSNLEDLTLTGVGNINATGNTLANVLTGNAGNNVLDGGTGADGLVGGAGNDTYVIDNAGDTVTEELDGGTDLLNIKTATAGLTYALGANVENAALLNTVAFNLTGNDLSNILTGNAAANVLTGAGGNDTLDGKGGSDTLIGGLGDDTYVVDGTGDVITEGMGEGTDTVTVALATAGATYVLGANVENGTLSGTVALNLTGSDVANVLTGNSAANKLDGGLGADVLIGGGGGDTYVVDDAGDSISETSTLAGEIDTVQSSISWTLGANLENLTLVGSAAAATGNALANTLTGNAGANRLDGGLGADKLNGGAGNDTYVVDNTGDTITETSTLAGEIDTVESSISWTLGSNLEDLTLTGVGNINATGNTLANVLTGNAGNNVLDGGTGADGLVGGAGNDTYVIDNAGDTVTEELDGGTDLLNIKTATAGLTYALGANVENAALLNTVAFNLTGNDLSNILTGNAAANVLTGAGGNDTLDGKGGSDTLIGGLGDDTYVVDGTGDVITEGMGEGTDTVTVALATAGATYVLGANVENGTLSGTVALNLTGSDVANVLTGNSAANKLDGGLGADVLIGGGGGDTYVVDDAGDSISETSTLAGEIDTVQSSISWTLGANLENLTLVGSAAAATGNALANTLTGNAGANRLDGGLGADKLNGGAGNDTYVVDNTGDTITETSTLAGEIDTVESSISWTLGSNLEDLTLTGVGNINATGNTLANVLTGNAGNNVLDGGTGADGLVGGAGNDTYVIDNAGDTVTEELDGGTDLLNIKTATAGLTYALGANVENAALLNTVAFNLTGNDLSNILTGNAAANVLTGAGGNDTLDGKGGSDTLIGGLGDDTYVVDGTGDVITEGMGEGTDTVTVALATAGATYVLGANVENGTLSGTVALNLTGSDVANVLTGNSAANKLDGGLGADVLIGGGGGDTYVVDDAGDSISETSTLAGEIDTVQSSISWTLGANLENLTLVGSAAAATGNALANTLTGNAGANRLDGGLGADKLNGGAGNDTYVVDNTGDTITETSTLAGEIDTVESSISWTLGSNLEDLTLTGVGNINATGNTLANVLTGNAGNNVLDGGTGADGLVGGAGNDTYVIDNAGDTVTEELDGGTDLLNIKTATAGLTYALGANVENAALLNTVAFNLTGNDLSNILTGNAAANVLTGAGGNDTLDGKGGSDTLIGGLGDDTYVVDGTGDVITEGMGEGTDTVTVALATAGATYVLGANVENGTLSGTVALNLTGSDVANVLTGNSAANKLDGGLGADVLIGGGGGDTYVVDDAGDSISETSTLAGEIDTVQSSISWTLGANLENLTLVGSAAAATGNALANTLTGNAGANRLDGGLGADKLNGGAGNDTYVVDNTGDTITETSTLAGEIDTVESSISWTLGSNLEDLTLTGVGNINATGNTLANVLTGNAGNNVLDGGTGADGLVGGAGNDTYVIDNAGDTVTEELDGGTDLLNIKTATAGLTYALGANVENAALLNTVAFNLTGNDLSNILTGNAAANVLTGAGGNDTLDGKGGSDTLIGGLGDDTYVVDGTGDVITEGMGEGTDTVTVALATAGATYVLGANVENGTLSGTVALNLTGSDVANVLTGNSAANTLRGLDGSDTIDGGAGIDALIGGRGSDIYFVDLIRNAATGAVSMQDAVTESLDEGMDTIRFRAANLGGLTAQTIVLGVNIENGDLTDTGVNLLNLTGNGLDNFLVGNVAANALNGGLGNDTLDGGNGNDVLTGGDGNDVFVFDTELGAANVDQISDFLQLADLIQLDETIFEALDVGGLSAEAFLVGAEASSATNRIIYDDSTGALYYDSDGVGGVAEIQFATLQIGLAINNTNFQVI
jgi:Ca2+-binding RTX toxin-like protein